MNTNSYLDNPFDTIANRIKLDLNDKRLTFLQTKGFNDMLDYFLSGHKSQTEDLRSHLIPVEKKNTVIKLSQIDFISFCEHHFIPFFGTIDISYEPNEYIIGIGHILQIVKVLSSKLQLQETLTEEIAATISNLLSPNGLYIKIEAKHMCTMIEHNKMTDIVTNYCSGTLKQN